VRFVEACLVLVFRESSTQKSGLREMEQRAAARSSATNLLIGRNSTVIPNNYLQLGREAKTFLHTRVRARRLLSGYIWTQPCCGERPAEFGPACISPAGRSALIRHHSLAHRHVHASLSVQSSSEISVIPSNDFSPFVLHGPAVQHKSSVGPDGLAKICPFRPLISSTIISYENHHL